MRQCIYPFGFVIFFLCISCPKEFPTGKTFFKVDWHWVGEHGWANLPWKCRVSNFLFWHATVFPVWGYTHIFKVNEIKWTVEQTMVGWISRWRVWTGKEEREEFVKTEEEKHVWGRGKRKLTLGCYDLCGVNCQLCPYSLSLCSFNSV